MGFKLNILGIWAFMIITIAQELQGDGSGDEVEVEDPNQDKVTEFIEKFKVFKWGDKVKEIETKLQSHGTRIATTGDFNVNYLSQSLRGKAVAIVNSEETLNFALDTTLITTTTFLDSLKKLDTKLNIISRNVATFEAGTLTKASLMLLSLNYDILYGLLLDTINSIIIEYLAIDSKLDEANEVTQTQLETLTEGLLHTQEGLKTTQEGLEEVSGKTLLKIEFFDISLKNLEGELALLTRREEDDEFANSFDWKFVDNDTALSWKVSLFGSQKVLFTKLQNITFQNMPEYLETMKFSLSYLLACSSCEWNTASFTITVISLFGMLVIIPFLMNTIKFIAKTKNIAERYAENTSNIDDIYKRVTDIQKLIKDVKSDHKKVLYLCKQIDDSRDEQSRDHPLQH